MIGSSGDYGVEMIGEENDEKVEALKDETLPRGTPSCGPGKSFRGCLEFLLLQFDSIPNPVNITLARYGNFTEERPTTGKDAIGGKREL